MKRYTVILMVVLFPIIALAKSPSLVLTGSVTKVSDGDTIKVQTASGVETIRLLGVDTPEKFATRYGYAECYGEESSKYVESLLPIGAQVYVEFYGNDKYSRDLADVYIGSQTGALVSRDIIRNGYGWVYKKGTKSRPYASLVKSELLAKRGKVGLWSPSTCGGKRLPAASTSSSGITIDSSLVVPATSLSCTNVPRYCTKVKTREEAQFYLNSCGATRFDADRDGIACEDIK